MVTILCIHRQEFMSHEREISELAFCIYGTNESALFNEKYFPPEGRVPGLGPKRVEHFKQYLLHHPRCIVIVYVDGHCAGFVIHIDQPFPNSVGFGLHPDYAQQGVMSQAWALIIIHCTCFQFPLYAYTSIRNVPANKFLLKNGFTLTNNHHSFFGESSNKYIHLGIMQN